MSWLAAGIVTGVLSALGGVGMWIYAIGKTHGYEQAKSKFITDRLEAVKMAAKVQIQPDISGADFIAGLRTKYDK